MLDRITSVALEIWDRVYGVTFLQSAVLVGLLLVGELLNSRLIRWLTKPAAAALFVSFGLFHSDLTVQALVTSWPPATAQARVCWGLILGMAGDILLIPDATFLLGLVAFLASHVLYLWAFSGLIAHQLASRGAQLTVDELFRSGGTFPAATATLALTAVLLFRVFDGRTGPLRLPVRAYMLVITVMVASSFKAYDLTGDVLLPVGAVMFFVSDIAVAIGKFVDSGVVHRIWGLPLYFAAQFVIAATVQKMVM
jgi:uncharacterized membrane protein YhhN